MNPLRSPLMLAVATLACSQALAQSAPAASRGQLLYQTHCVGCHDTQMHWRDDKIATDWGSLKLQVRRWQARGSLNWSEADIVAVTRHLNGAIYRFPQSEDRVGLAPLR